MGRSAIVLGGAGQIGLAVTARLLDAGWAARVVGRGERRLPADLIERGARFVAADRYSDDGLRKALNDGADALIDITAYDASDAHQLLDFKHDLGALVVISSSSVYRDDQGRTLDEAAINGFPDLPDPIPETQSTVAPGPETYSTRKVALEQALLAAQAPPVTVLRPGAIHGVGSIHPREWWFVKRILDGRQAIPLAYEGRSRFHTTSVLNIAALVGVVLERPATRVLNVADPEALSVQAIGETIARHMDYSGAFRPLDGGRVGRTPWSTRRPFVLDTRAAQALGYEPVAHYATTTGAICDDLARTAAGRDWRKLFPVLAGYPYDQFDYAVEDVAMGA